MTFDLAYALLLVGLLVAYAAGSLVHPRIPLPPKRTEPGNGFWDYP